MVKVKDLMVGNLVKSPQGIIEGDNVLTNSVIAKYDKRSIYIFHATDLEPIPVTKEILKNIGFKEDKVLVSFYRYWDKDDKYKLDVDEGYTNSGRMWSVHIDNDVCSTIGSGEFDYVHELQNLVRIITGFSLPITKEMVKDV